MAVIDGPDVSSYQPNWKPKAADDFMFAKVTQGTSYVNPEYKDQIAAARKADLVVGHYIFTEGKDIDGEVSWFRQHADVRRGDLIVVDWETAGTTCAEKDRLLKALKNVYPDNKVGLYCNKNYWLNRDTTSFVQDFLWIAAYGVSDPGIQFQWTFWQYTDKPIDRSKSIFKTKQQLKNWANGKTVPVVIDKRAKVKFRGGWTCGCVATSLPLVEQDMIKHGIIKHNIDIFQLGYRNDVAASAGTHSKGGCTDVAQYSDEALKIWRKWGWTMQHRTPAQGFMHHAHGFPYGCPHLAPLAQKQADAWKHERDGLIQNKKVTGPGWQVLDWKDAIKQFAGDGTAEKANEKKAVDDKKQKQEGVILANPVKFHRTKNQKFAAPKKGQKAKFHSLKIDDRNDGSYSFISGPGTISVVASVRVDKPVKARFVTMNWKPGHTKIATAYPYVTLQPGGDQIELYDSIAGLRRVGSLSSFGFRSQPLKAAKCRTCSSEPERKPDAMNVVLPKKPRLIAYVVLASVTMLVIPGAAVWFTSVGEPVPQLLVRIGAIASFVSGNALVLAALNINKGDKLLNDSQIKETIVPVDEGSGDDEDIDEEVEDLDTPDTEIVEAPVK
jgi:hypothetical protein